MTEYQETLLTHLARNPVWPEGVLPDQVIETHISTVLLVGNHAYKIKKPLNLGFLDFSTLEKRHRYCLEEIRLNSRLAPDVYLDVVSITGTPEQPTPFGEGEVIEYAVRMRRFDQAGLLSAHPELISPELVDQLADRLVAFHASVDVVAADQPFGCPDVVLAPMYENFAQIRSLSDSPPLHAQLAQLEGWTQQTAKKLHARLLVRQAGGFIRECHGDLHLGNIALEKDALLIFDGIEFNPALRWIDVISEVAFLLMDVDEQGMPNYSQRLLNRYLELSGDYEALPLLRFYQVYRAMVRAKVCAIRLHQQDLESDEKRLLTKSFQGYLDLAARYSKAGLTGVMITHGYSGSGKSTLTAMGLEQLPAIRLRSDVERRRLAGLAVSGSSNANLADGLYRPEMTANTYQRLADVARLIVESGWIAIIDATFLRHEQRNPFRLLADTLGVPFVILDLDVPLDELERRVEHRQAVGNDPSEATLEVLQHQLTAADPLTPIELKSVVQAVSPEFPLDKIMVVLDKESRPV
ncbi:bifunctional aminoglycoside phosphotransferase/ATP-binding protein [Sedimenticola selenatireducens]|uniref:AAA family ATPase n=1 Tax=Sedimenticola selenatireducens TaxID=191960 RepID=A0A557SM19_9GAMM|nr:bifunctional aminoglycoside phosphotransferase/ATP-binding protein [Sedimenticola selenatireducens]TVO78390.1 AAA family ATPase [Sedimenticola selenatireducens]